MLGITTIYIGFLYISKADQNKVGNDGSGHRLKATYIQHPHYPKYDRLEELIKIRPIRRIEKEDMEKIWPEWNAEEY